MAEQVFVGRERELTRLASMLTATMAGEAHVCFVTGEAGAGADTRSVVGGAGARQSGRYRGCLTRDVGSLILTWQ